MPHVRIDYSPNIGGGAHMDALCQAMLHGLLALRGADRNAIVPAAGTRVFAYPAAHAAVGPGDEDRGFLYVNLRVTPGRTQDALAQIGAAVQHALTQHFQHYPPLVACRFTIHIDEGRPVFEGKGELLAEDK